MFLYDYLLLNDEWFASAVGIAITFVVFVMGIPALLFQTFIPESYRSIYNKRLGSEWRRSLTKHLGLVLLLFILSHSGIIGAGFWFLNYLFCIWLPTFGKETTCFFAEIVYSATILILLVIVLIRGYEYLLKNFRGPDNLGKLLTENIVKTIQAEYPRAKDIKIKAEDLEDLEVLAKSLPEGEVKNQYLKQCENLVEFFLKQEPLDGPVLHNISDVLEKAVCQSVTYDGGQANRENKRKALDILLLTYNGLPKRDDLEQVYLKRTIASCMKDIGERALAKDDILLATQILEKLSELEATEQEMFTLASAALDKGEVRVPVMSTKILAGKTRNMFLKKDSLSAAERRVFYFWFAMTAKIHAIGGAARDFSNRQIARMRHDFAYRRDALISLLTETKGYFYTQADFKTLDSLAGLEEDLLKE
jgi:hypothetical protein